MELVPYRYVRMNNLLKNVVAVSLISGADTVSVIESAKIKIWRENSRVSLILLASSARVAGGEIK